MWTFCSAATRCTPTCHTRLKYTMMMCWINVSWILPCVISIETRQWARRYQRSSDVTARDFTRNSCLRLIECYARTVNSMMWMPSFFFYWQPCDCRCYRTCDLSLLPVRRLLLCWCKPDRPCIFETPWYYHPWKPMNFQYTQNFQFDCLYMIRLTFLLISFLKNAMTKQCSWIDMCGAFDSGAAINN